jgi:hypothetical protein
VHDLRTSYATNEAADVAHANLQWATETHAVPEKGYTVTTVQTLTPAQLRTVPMPDLRSPIARTLDAQRRNLEHIDTRTADERVTAEFVRLVDCLQVVYLRLDELERQQPALEYVAQHLERLERRIERTMPPDIAALGYTEQVDYWNSVQHLAAQRLGALSAAGVAA